MNILFLTLLSMENINDRNIYTDLIHELKKNNNIYVVSPREKRSGLDTDHIIFSESLHVLKVRTGNITKTNFVEKGISTLLIEDQYLRAIKKYFKGVHFDMVVYATPPITFGKIIKYFKKHHGSKTYLMLKDIFPQNAVDLGIIKKNSLVWKFFNRKEKKLYRFSDKIGCMSQGNMDYILHHNKFLDIKKVEVFPNAINPIEKIKVCKKNEDLLRKYNIPTESILFVYGGNLGKPQGIDFILEVIHEFYKVENGFLLIVGSGTEFQRIKDNIEINKPKQVGILNSLTKEEYDLLMESSDVGLVFLDKRFTIPNFPSRLTCYLEFSLPVLAATDKTTDLKDVIRNAEIGLWSESSDVNQFIENAKILAQNDEQRKLMGSKGRKFLEDNYDVRKTVNLITKR